MTPAAGKKGRKEIKRRVEPVFEHCSECEYKGSFHVLLQRVSGQGPCNVKLRLKCPNCEQVYDVGLHAALK